MSDTTLPDTEPVNVPLEAVFPHVPVKDVPSCEMLTRMTQDVVRSVSQVVPAHRPATFAFAIEGAVGVELQPVVSATARAMAASPRRCMWALHDR